MWRIIKCKKLRPRLLKSSNTIKRLHGFEDRQVSEEKKNICELNENGGQKRFVDLGGEFFAPR